MTQTKRTVLRKCQSFRCVITRNSTWKVLKLKRNIGDKNGAQLCAMGKYVPNYPVGTEPSAHCAPRCVITQFSRFRREVGQPELKFKCMAPVLDVLVVVIVLENNEVMLIVERHDGWSVAIGVNWCHRVMLKHKTLNDRYNVGISAAATTITTKSLYLVLCL